MRTSNQTHTERMLGLLGRYGILPAAELAQELQVSRATLSRSVAVAGDRVVRIGKARNTRYALRRNIRGESSWPVYRIDTTGQVQSPGTLIALHGGQFLFEPQQESHSLLRPPFADGLFPDLPWFLDDQRPQGFLGHSFAHRMAETLRLPADLKVWSSEHNLVAMLHGGSTQAGDLLLGESALRSALAESAQPSDLVAAADRPQRYPAMAAEVMKGEPPGSSPAGEQPKFTSTVDGRDGARHAAIVKFADAAAGPGARRWAALLRCEALAGKVLAASGVAAAQAEILEAADTVFLESRRFDRIGRDGRCGYVSLSTIDAAFYGHGAIAWWRFADELERDGWLAATAATDLRRIAWFGALIGNTDMHLGNAGLMLSNTLPLPLAPVFDMLPTVLAPSSQGVVVERDFQPPPPTTGQLAPWRWAAAAATGYWHGVETAAVPQIDDAIRRFARTARERIAQLMMRFGAE